MEQMYIQPQVSVPAHAGGVDLSAFGIYINCHNFVPAHAGGVDLSTVMEIEKIRAAWSPPMRAGWI